MCSRLREIRTQSRTASTKWRMRQTKSYNRCRSGTSDRREKAETKPMWKSSTALSWAAAFGLRILEAPASPHRTNGNFCFSRLYLPGRTKKEEGIGRRWTAEDIANLKKLAQPSDRTKFASEVSLRIICGTPQRLALHRAENNQRALLAVSHPSDSEPLGRIRKGRHRTLANGASVRGRGALGTHAVGSNRNSQ
jgi:hypothetical protein